MMRTTARIALLALLVSAGCGDERPPLRTPLPIGPIERQAALDSVALPLVLLGAATGEETPEAGVLAATNLAVAHLWLAITSLRGASPLARRDFDPACITVTTTSGWKNPTITSVDPRAARPRDLITVRGTDFHDGLTVLFNGTSSPNVKFDASVDVTMADVEVPEMPAGGVRLTVVNVDGRFSQPMGFAVIRTPPRFIRGDFDLDGIVDISDAVRILLHLFRGLAVSCQDAGDVNNDEVLGTADAIQLLDFLYGDGEAPAAPFPDPGWEREDEGPLGCRAGL